MNALEAVKFENTDATTPDTTGADTAETPASNGLNRPFLRAALENCTQEHDIFMIRYNGLRDVLSNPNSSDEQVRKAFTTFKRSMTDFRMSLKSIPGKL